MQIDWNEIDWNEIEYQLLVLSVLCNDDDNNYKTRWVIPYKSTIYVLLADLRITCNHPDLHEKRKKI